jgi:hypothetical protein
MIRERRETSKLHSKHLRRSQALTDGEMGHERLRERDHFEKADVLIPLDVEEPAKTTREHLIPQVQMV